MPSSVAISDGFPEDVREESGPWKRIGYGCERRGNGLPGRDRLRGGSQQCCWIPPSIPKALAIPNGLKIVILGG